MTRRHFLPVVFAALAGFAFAAVALHGMTNHIATVVAIQPPR